MNISNPLVIKSLLRQQNDLLTNHPEGVKIRLNPEDLLDIQADIIGPVGTPYENGVFKVKLVIPNDFPSTAPKGYFLNKIFHPNVSAKGEICVNTLKKDWNSKQWSLFHVFQVIRCLLIIPFPESSLNEEAGRLFQDNYLEYFKLAKLYTSIHSCLTSATSNLLFNNKLNENNNRSNIINNEYLHTNNKEQEKISVLSKNMMSEIYLGHDIEMESFKHSKSLIMNDKNSINIVEQKLNLNNFSRANSLKVNQTTSKTKQDEIKKWLSRI